MSTGVYSEHLSKLDFTVKEIKFLADVEKESKSCKDVKDFVSTIETSSLEKCKLNQARDLYSEAKKHKEEYEALHQTTKNEITNEEKESLFDYCNLLESKIEELELKEERKKNIKENKYSIMFLSLGGLLAIAYAVLTLVGIRIDLLFAVPIIIAFTDCADYEGKNWIKIIPYCLIGGATITEGILDIIQLYGPIKFYAMLRLAFALVIMLCMVFRNVGTFNLISERLFLCITATMWSVYFYLMFNVALGCVYESIWHMLWFVPIPVAVVGGLARIIDKKKDLLRNYVNITFALVSMLFVFILALSYGAFGLEVIAFIIVYLGLNFFALGVVLDDVDIEKGISKGKK